MIRFTVPGQPLPTARPRSGPQGGRLYTPAASLAAQAGVLAAFRAQVPGHRVNADWSWAVKATFYRETWASADVDNLVKTVLDGLQGHLFANDAQVSDLHGVRVLGVGKGQGRTVVEARPVGPHGRP